MQKILNIGCKLNQYEGFCLLKKYVDVEDVVIINTCCVTREAEIKSLKKFRYALKRYPKSTIIATGCACRLYPEKYAHAHEVIDNVERNALIKDILPTPKKARYFLKIQDGCSGCCTYCVVSKVRNKVESKALHHIKEEIDWACSLGYKEIVLVGANIGLYGSERGLRLKDLLIGLRDVPDLPRIRLSSIEPQFIDSDLVACLKDIPFCRHLHIPIQSADDDILSTMRRNYDNAFLNKIVDIIYKGFDDVAIGADIIVGFPTEGEKEYSKTYTFVESNPITHLHVFSYSPRPGTEAFTLGDPVPKREKKRRLWQLKSLIGKKNYEFRQALKNKTFTIITEKNNSEVSGFSDNYVRIIVDGEQHGNVILDVRITDVTSEKTFGEIVHTH